MLQWGRGHVTAEMASRRVQEHLINRLQWGRGHVTAEMGAEGHAALFRLSFNGAAAT